MKKYENLSLWATVIIRIIAEFVWIYYIWRETGIMTALYLLALTFDHEVKNITRMLERESERLRNDIIEHLIKKSGEML